MATGFGADEVGNRDCQRNNDNRNGSEGARRKYDERDGRADRQMTLATSVVTLGAGVWRCEGESVSDRRERTRQDHNNMRRSSFRRQATTHATRLRTKIVATEIMTRGVEVRRRDCYRNSDTGKESVGERRKNDTRDCSADSSK